MAVRLRTVPFRVRRGAGIAEINTLPDGVLRDATYSFYIGDARVGTVYGTCFSFGNSARVIIPRRARERSGDVAMGGLVIPRTACDDASRGGTSAFTALDTYHVVLRHPHSQAPVQIRIGRGLHRRRRASQSEDRQPCAYQANS